MSVDEAFRKLIQGPGAPAIPRATPAVAATPAPGTAAPQVCAPAPVPPAPVSPAPVLTAPVAPVASAAPVPPVEAPPPEEPYDLSRVQRVPRFAYQPEFGERSQVAEEYRILRTRIQSLTLPRPSLLLTSCHHNEGKTNTSLFLALSMARRRGARILLVDFDLRRPRLHKLLGLPQRKEDVGAVVRGTAEPESAMLYSEEDNLYVLCANGPRHGSTDYLESKGTRKLIARLHASFDFVVFDSCPCLSTSDAAVVGPFVGGVVMVVRCLKTQRESVEHAVNTLQDVGVSVVGTVLTFIKYFLPPYLFRYQYYHGYYYYHDKPNGSESDAIRTDPSRADAPPAA